MDVYHFLFNIILIHPIFSFNLDVNSPIIYTDPEGDFFVNRPSYFGYSLVLYPGKRSIAPWIQIGAPRGRNTVFTSGSIFKCRIGEKCEKLLLDLESLNGISNVYNSSLHGAWMGGSMDINYKDDTIVMCAFRWIWIWQGEYHDYRTPGACIIESINSTEIPRVNLNPLLNKKLQIYSHGKTHIYNYGLGQAGFSLKMVEDENDLLMGSPGLLNWHGSSILVKRTYQEAPIASRFSARSRFLRQTYANQFDDIYVANALRTNEVLSYELLGYAVTSGKFYNRNKTVYVSAAPKSLGYKGQILIHTFTTFPHSNEAKIDVIESKKGMQFGEYFGASLTSGDINNDGYDDLIVGAPFHLSETYNEGKVYIFLGSEGKLKIPEQGKVIIGEAVGGQLGTALQYLGDIDHDGFGDIAISAPYEEQHSGVVYIYRGSNKGLHTSTSQRIVGKDIYSEISGFGISFSRAIDIDDNSYPDIAIGAHKSGHAVILRTKPVITIYHSLKSFESRIDPNNKQFIINTCFWFSLDVAFDSINILKKFRIDEPLGRATLLREPLEEIIALNPGMQHCRNITLQLEEKLLNTYDPLTIKLSTSFIPENITKAPFIIGNKMLGMDRFCPRCPIYNKYTSSKEESIQIPFTLGCGDDNVCNANLEFSSRFSTLGKDNIFILGSSNMLKLETMIRNTGEKAYLTQLLVILPEALNFIRIPSLCLPQNLSSVLCNVDNPLGEGKEKSVILDLDMSGVNTGKYGDSLNISVITLTSSNNTNNNRKNIILNLKREADITISGKSDLQSYSISNSMKNKPNFTQIYQIQKFGRSPIEEISIEILIPHAITVKNQMIDFLNLYIPIGFLAGQPIVCKSDFEYLVEVSKSADDNINEAVLMPTQNIEEHSRKKRQVEVLNASSIKSKSKEDLIVQENEYSDNRTFYINCSTSTITCSKIYCSAGPFESVQTVGIIDIKMEFDHLAIEGLLKNKDIVLITTEANVYIKRPSNFIQSGDQPDYAIVTSIFVGDIVKPTVAIWIIIVSVIAGLLLLLLLILGLIKAGFFKRTTKEELEQLKQEIENEEGIEATLTEDEEVSLRGADCPQSQDTC